uniref:Cytochrome c biogenesis protein CcsA n=1 Tax=Closterium baillyanum TaxID=1416941 RepID=A0A191T5S9_9VIRI|nr:heme attachment to plastid cytochrome c [Closterium baillyanum]ANI25732.1 heme attachment to plastid cytochrome c [Closterium baillyanum]
MILSTLEEILIQLCFAIFLLGTIFSWSNLTIYSTNQTRSFSKKIMVVGRLCITGLLVIRWLVADHLPLSNFYESFLFLAWSFTLVSLLLDKKVQNDWLDAIIAPSVMITYTFATLGLPKEMQQITVLVPALQSNWLMMHVSMMILSYGALLFGSLLAVTLLTLSPVGSTNPELRLNTTNLSIYIGKKNSTKEFPSVPLVQAMEDKKSSELLYFEFYKASLIDQLDYWSYRIIGMGFPILTLGILSGAVWANESWGAYWSWDPKETWALITWLIFAIYLHLRMTRGWAGTKAAVVASLGFAVVWMCYLGVNLLGKGLHSYGWFT